MRISKKGNSTFTRGDGVVSHLLQPHESTDDEAETDLTVTLVEVEPGAKQTVHSHEPEQVYVIIAGEGVMQVGTEERRVESGESVHIPPNTQHGIENTGDEILEYISAATPAFPQDQIEEFYDG